MSNELIEAVWEGDEALVIGLIERGANVNFRDTDMRNTPLHIAAMKGRENIVRLLLERGARVDELNFVRETPLYLAAKYKGSYGIMQELIDRGADVNSLNRGGNIISALMYKGNVEFPSKQPITEEYVQERAKFIKEKTKFMDELIDKGVDVKGERKLDNAIASELGRYTTNPRAFNTINTDTVLCLLSAGVEINSTCVIDELLINMPKALEPSAISFEKKYLGLKLLSQDPSIRGKERINEVLKELKKPAYDSLIDKIRAGFDDQKVENKYRQIAEEMLPDYPTIPILKQFAEGKITSEGFATKYNLQFSESINMSRNTSAGVKKVVRKVLEDDNLLEKISEYLPSEDLRNLRDTLRDHQKTKKAPSKESKVGQPKGPGKFFTQGNIVQFFKGKPNKGRNR